MVRELGTEGSQGTAQTHVPNRQGHAESQDPFLVHENIYVINEGSGDGSLELNEKKASYIFAGIRKIIEAERTPLPEEAPLTNGQELTYSVLEVDTLDEVLALARGEMVDVLYRE
jgi:hypothetical protein